MSYLPSRAEQMHLLLSSLALGTVLPNTEVPLCVVETEVDVLVPHGNFDVETNVNAALEFEMGYMGATTNDLHDLTHYNHTFLQT